MYVATAIFRQVIWIDTGYLPIETYQYADELIELLGLNVQVYQSSVTPARMEAMHGKLWERHDVDGHRQYGLLRKVEPMQVQLQLYSSEK